MWNTEVAQQRRLIMYRQFKRVFEPEAYLRFDMPMYLRKRVSRFRISNHNLKIELGRHRNIQQENRVCKICEDEHIHVIENEIHFVLDCDSYSQLRRKYIDERFHGQPLQTNFINLFSSRNEETIRNDFFIHTALKVITK